MLQTELTKIENELKDHPKIKNLRIFLDDFFKRYSAQFIILFGSSAKKSYNYMSDLDLLVVSNSLKNDYFERLFQMQEITPGGIDFFVYTLNEFEKMVANFHLIALEALDTGILIYDTGPGQQFVTRIQSLKKENRIQKLDHGWKINADL